MAGFPSFKNFLLTLKRQSFNQDFNAFVEFSVANDDNIHI